MKIITYNKFKMEYFLFFCICYYYAFVLGKNDIFSQIEQHYGTQKES